MNTTTASALCALLVIGTLLCFLWDPTRFRKPKPAPKIRLGDHVTIVYGDVPIGRMVLVDFSDSYSGGKEARLVDVATFEARNRV